MKMMVLNAGGNVIDNVYGHIGGIQYGKVVSIEVYSNSPGEVTISQKVGSFSRSIPVATVTVSSDGYGVAANVGKYFAYGDKLVVSGLPVESGNEYVVRCFYE